MNVNIFRKRENICMAGKKKRTTRLFGIVPALVTRNLSFTFLSMHTLTYHCALINGISYLSLGLGYLRFKVGLENC